MNITCFNQTVHLDNPSAKLTGDDYQRYHRQLLLPAFGPAGQTRLKQAKVLVVGAGGLGCPILLYLAGMGVGTLGIIDHDRVALSNLHRQVLYSTSALGQCKVTAAQTAVLALNPTLTCHAIEARLTYTNVESIIQDYDLVIDASDNFSTRYLINDTCVLQGKPLIAAAISQFQGQIAVFNHQGSACYRCLYPEPPPSNAIPDCTEGGVMGILPGILGTLQANEAIKLLAKIGTCLTNRLLIVDSLTNRYQQLQFDRQPDCLVCAGPITERLPESAYPDPHRIGVSCGTTMRDNMSDNLSDNISNHAPFNISDSHHASLSTAKTSTSETSIISPQTLADWLNEKPETLQLIDVREPHEYAHAHLQYNCAQQQLQSDHLPLSTIRKNPKKAAEMLIANKTVVVHCRSGQRSQEAITLLQAERPQLRCVNLGGGLQAWAMEIDPRFFF